MKVQFRLRTMLLAAIVVAIVVADIAYLRAPRLERDVEARIRRDFSFSQRREVRQRLLDYDPDSPRLHRCILHTARGDMDRLREMIELARMDYRDAILAAEYDGFPDYVRVYDFNRPFEEAGNGPIDP